jgi:hypothetical protein
MGSEVFDRLLWSITHDSLTLSRAASSSDVSTSNVEVVEPAELMWANTEFLGSFWG